MGRNREPTALLQAKGKSHKSKQELKERAEMELKVDLTDVEAPPELPEEMQEEFYEIAAKLAHVDRMLFTELDEDVLARYLIAKRSYLDATRLVEREMSKKRGQDIDRLAKLTRIQNTYEAQCRANASDLCLTVSSRMKILIPKTDDEPKENRFSKFNRR